MTDENERAVQAAIDGELRLLDPEVRASPALFRELMDPEFTEIGASGRWWDAESILTVRRGVDPHGDECGNGVSRVAGQGQQDVGGHAGSGDRSPDLLITLNESVAETDSGLTAAGG